jgi:HAD superfamily phosphatase (TIGR01668 family)
MFNILKPDYYYNDVLEIKQDMLREKGIKGILFDIDNTLTKTNSKETDKKIKDFLINLSENGMKILLLTNANKDRVKRFDLNDSFPIIHSALKPFKTSFKKALKILNVKNTDIMMVGDQIFTDIYGGNRMKMKTILIRPIKIYDENIFVRFKRHIENAIIKR